MTITQSLINNARSRFANKLLCFYFYLLPHQFIFSSAWPLPLLFFIPSPSFPLVTLFSPANCHMVTLFLLMIFASWINKGEFLFVFGYTFVWLCILIEAPELICLGWSNSHAKSWWQDSFINMSICGQKFCRKLSHGMSFIWNDIHANLSNNRFLMFSATIVLD